MEVIAYLYEEEKGPVGRGRERERVRSWRKQEMRE